MGAWGLGVFENDTSCDFASAVADGGGIDALREAIERVLSSRRNYLEASDAEEGLAAADIVARLRGNPGQQSTYTAAVDAWVAKSKAVAADELVQKAKQVVARILAEPSELLELWAESQDFDGWKRAVEDVARRL
ncbi:MAG TPA: DUF4259 domain-containing protein [Bradyrhizobium sp.]